MATMCEYQPLDLRHHIDISNAEEYVWSAVDLHYFGNKETAGFFKAIWTLSQLNTYINVLIAFFCILTNSVILLAIKGCKELHSVSGFPIAFQAFADIVFSGVCRIIIFLVHIASELSTESSAFLYNGSIAKFLRIVSLVKYGIETHCFMSYLVDICDNYFTAFCILNIAFVRFMCICRPFTFKEIEKMDG